MMHPIQRQKRRIVRDREEPKNFCPRCEDEILVQSRTYDGMVLVCRACYYTKRMENGLPPRRRIRPFPKWVLGVSASLEREMKKKYDINDFQ